jgi:hypothetical protein
MDEVKQAEQRDWSAQVESVELCMINVQERVINGQTEKALAVHQMCVEWFKEIPESQITQSCKEVVRETNRLLIGKMRGNE